MLSPSQPLQKDNYPSSRTKLASLVKGEVLSPEKIRATTEGIALHHQPFQNRTILSLRTTFLPPLSKGGGLTARHKLSLCCILLAIRPSFLFTKLFCRQDGGIAAPPHPFSFSDTAANNPSKTALSLKKLPSPLPPLEKGEVA